MASLIFRSTEALLKTSVNAKWYVKMFFDITDIKTVYCRAPIGYAKLNTSIPFNAQKDAVLKNEVAFLTQEELEQKQKLQGYITVQPVSNHISIICMRRLI